MSAAFTPGPWILNLPDPMERPFARDATVRAKSWGYIATIGIDTSLPHWDKPQRANARLIAAAPRMFAVIEKSAAAGDAECLAIVEAVNGRA